MSHSTSVSGHSERKGSFGPRVDRLIADLAGRQHGVVGRRQLLQAGVTVGAIEGRLRRGRLHPLHRGVYAVGHRVVSADGRWMAAVLAAGPGAVLSHRSAGQAWRLLSPAPHRPEVTRSRGWRSPAGIAAHQGRIPADERVVLDEIPVTSVPRTLLDLAAVSSRRQLERAMHEAEVRQLTDRLSIPVLLARYPRRSGAANLGALLHAQAPVGTTQNELAERFVGFLDRHRLPRPLLNGTLPIRGRLLRPDCMWPQARLLVELDGRAVHGTGAAFEADRERDRILLVEGWRSLRVTWRQLRDEPAAIAGDLRTLLARDGQTSYP